MIEMGVREQNQIDMRKLRPKQRGRHYPFQANRHRPHSNAATIAEYRIGEDHAAVNLQEHRAVAEPSRMQPYIGPLFGLREKGRRPNWALSLVLHPSEKPRRRAARKLCRVG